MHRWINVSEEQPARVLAILLPREPFKVAGQYMEETHILN